MFTSLKSLFRAQTNASETEETVEEVVTDEVIESPEEEPTEESETPAEEPAESAPEAAITPNVTNAVISRERLASLEASEKELSTFGATAADRAKVLAETKTLYAWYENVKKLGITIPGNDASQITKTKEKKVSATTQEAIDLQNRLAKNTK